MPRAVTMYSPYGIGVANKDGKSFKYIGKIEDIKHDNPNALMIASNLDYLSFLHLHFSSLPNNSTFAWLPAHCIEKYLKAVLLATKQVSRSQLKKKYGHSIRKLWKKYLEYDPALANYSEFIEEVAEIGIDVRYGESDIGYNDKLVSTFIKLTSYLRSNFVHYKNDTIYGIPKHLIGQTSFSGTGYNIEVLNSIHHLVVEQLFTAIMN